MPHAHISWESGPDLGPGVYDEYLVQRIRPDLAAGDPGVASCEVSQGEIQRLRNRVPSHSRTKKDADNSYESAVYSVL